MVPHPSVREKTWREHCPGSTVVKYSHPSGRTSYTYVSASGEANHSWRDCLMYMMDMVITSNAPTKLEKGTFWLWTAKREYRARVWKEKGGKVINNTYRRDNLPNGQLCVLYVTPEGKKFRSWKQCVRYMGEDPLKSVSWKNMSSNGEETNPSPYLQSSEIQALPWKHVGSTNPSSPGEKASLNGCTSVAQKAETLNVISSSSEGSHDQKTPSPSRQAIISISSSKEIENENDGSSSSSSESSEESLSAAAASSSSASGNSALSSSSSEDLDDDREDVDLQMANGVIRLHSGPSQDSVEKPDNQQAPPLLLKAREEGHTSDLQAVMVEKPLLLLSTRNNDSEEDAAIQSPNLPSKSDAALNLHNEEVGAASAGEAVCVRKSQSEERGNTPNAPTAAAIGIPPDNKAGSSVRKRKVCEGGGESVATKPRGKCRAVAEEPLTSLGTKPSRAEVLKKKTEHEDDSPGDQSSDDSETSLKELMWRSFEVALKRKKSMGSSSRRNYRKDSGRGRTGDSNCCSQGATIIVVCPCSVRKSHK